MQVDKTTLQDLSIFHHDEAISVYQYIDFTRTNGGREYLRSLLNKPFTDLDKILNTQQLLQRIISIHDQWPVDITNGTIMVVEKFYETALSELPRNPNSVNTFFYKLLNGPDFSLTRYSVTHFIDFIQGMHALATQLHTDEEMPVLLDAIVKRISTLLKKITIQDILHIPKKKFLEDTHVLSYGRFFRFQYKSEIQELVKLHSQLDACYSMATACKKYQLCFPEFINTSQPLIKAEGLYHLLLPHAVSYDITLDAGQNFLFLTGANMAGKSTFIKAIGITAYLAHIGMGVPAKSVSMSLLDGLLSNIQVVDNVTKGESYFFNEVQRIRKTIEKISDGKKWLILIDELFKGTNIQDAMKCSTAVIEGLRKIPNALFILSTHLYEISNSLQQYPNIQFRYFETTIKDEQLQFSYHLKEGVSEDRLGYLILKREGVVDLLEKL